MKTIVPILAMVAFMASPESVAGQHPEQGRIQLELEMTDGSRLLAIPAERNPVFVLKTRLGPVSAPLGGFERFEVADKGGEIVLRWSDGDRLTGRPGFDSLKVRSILGLHSIALSSVRSGKVTVLPAAPALKPASVKVSGTYGHGRKGEYGNHQVSYASDGDLGTSWSSGDWKGWIEFDLGDQVEIACIKAHLQFDPPGSATHEIRVCDEPIGNGSDRSRLLQGFSGTRKNGDVLAVSCPPGTKARFVQVRCLSARSWFNLRELEVFSR